jgi:hypothetical protein
VGSILAPKPPLPNQTFISFLFPIEEDDMIITDGLLRGFTPGPRGLNFGAKMLLNFPNQTLLFLGRGRRCEHC